MHLYRSNSEGAEIIQQTVVGSYWPKQQSNEYMWKATSLTRYLHTSATKNLLKRFLHYFPIFPNAGQINHRQRIYLFVVERMSFKPNISLNALPRTSRKTEKHDWSICEPWKLWVSPTESRRSLSDAFFLEQILRETWSVHACGIISARDWIAQLPESPKESRRPYVGFTFSSRGALRGEILPTCSSVPHTYCNDCFAWLKTQSDLLGRLFHP